MRWTTIEQILRVIAYATQYFRQGYGIDRAYQNAVKLVAQEDSVAYQTIGDACRRRLGLTHVGEFKSMLRSALEKDPSDLRNAILRKAPSLYRDRIEESFSKVKNGRTITEAKSSGPLVSYTVQLSKGDSDILRALSQLLDGQPEVILAKVAADAVKERMKQAVSRL